MTGMVAAGEGKQAWLERNKMKRRTGCEAGNGCLHTPLKPAARAGTAQAWPASPKEKDAQGTGR